MIAPDPGDRDSASEAAREPRLPRPERSHRRGGGVAEHRHGTPAPRGRRRAFALPALAAATLGLSVFAPGAVAGPPGKWTRVAPTDSNVQRIAVHRTADGVLHFAWVPRLFSAPKAVLLHGALAANAKRVDGPDTIFASTDNGAALLPQPALVAGPGGGLRAFFSGTADDLPGPYGIAETATAPAAGAPWSGPAASSDAIPGRASDVVDLAAATLADGTPVTAWSGRPPGYHAGLNPAAPDVAVGGPCGPPSFLEDTGVAVDAVTGAIVVAYHCTANPATFGVHAQSPPGSAANQVAPGSRAFWSGQMVAVTGRLGAGKGGVYAAYGFGDNRFNARPALWRFGDSTATVLKVPADAEHTTLAAAPEGRLWMAWEGKDRGHRLYAMRGNRDARPIGTAVGVKPPTGTHAIHSVAVEGSRGALDLLALVERSDGDTAFWHRRVLPGLRVRVKAGKAKAGKRKLRFAVTDAGDPVKGAKVSVAGYGSAKTSKKGRATVGVKAGNRKRRVKVTRSGYTTAKLRVRAG